MLRCDERDIDVFFDSADCLSPPQELGCDKFDYQVWVNEPGNVKERRHRFLQEMGFPDICSKNRIGGCRGAATSGDQVVDKLVFSGGNVACEANDLFDELKTRPGNNAEKASEHFSFAPEIRHTEVEATEDHTGFNMGIKKRQNWWKRLMNTKKVGRGGGKTASKLNTKTNRSHRIKVRQRKKMWMELSALYTGQEIRAHKGLIWSLKFSPNGQYLASGGEDRIIRIWRVISQDTSTSCNSALDSFLSKVKQDISSWKKQSSQTPIFLPKKVIQLEETPLQEFYGHSSDILDLAWFNSDILLSASMDKTVRLWRVGCNQCLSVFPHKDYVTSIQFNPVDEKYFISGSIDGKVRIWGTYEGRVVDWADVRDVITAISYQPDGKGFVVGSITGTCRYYVASGKYFQLEAQIDIHGRKRTASNKITGIQFCQDKHQRVMITSEDSKLRILDGIDVVQKYKGLSKSGSQMSGSFTCSGRHIISVGEDCRVYVWNYGEMENASSKQTKSERSCEHFYSEGVTVAIPWSGMRGEQRVPSNIAHCRSAMQDHTCVRELERFSFGNWFSIDATCRGSTTWPEEKLPIWDLPFREGDYDQHQHSLSETWGLSIVTADCNGTIKTFHNLGLPVRV